jgi:UDP:flavonoid glycosyltransferase YjiC (YdhE family)
VSPIVFVEMPAYGHVNPTLPLVRELAQRGEHVVYFNAEEFQAQVERAGATFHAYPAGGHRPGHAFGDMRMRVILSVGLQTDR